MGQEVHITRGSGFAAPGDQPITAEQWEQLGDSNDALELRKAGSAFGRLLGHPVVFRGGIISVTSPGPDALPVLLAIAATLGARAFGEDGIEIGLDVIGEVRSTLASALPQLDTSTLDEPLARNLIAVASDATSVADSVQKNAVVFCSRLRGPQAEVGLSYLACRAQELGGTPPAASTCVAAHLVRHASWRLASFRSEPTLGWVTEVEALAKLVAKKPGAYVVSACTACGAKNRVPLFPPADKQPTCGRCKTPLAL